MKHPTKLVCKHWAAASPHAVKGLIVKGAFPEGSFTQNLSALQSFTCYIPAEVNRYDVSPLTKPPLKSLSIAIEGNIIPEDRIHEITMGLETLTARGFTMITEGGMIGPTIEELSVENAGTFKVGKVNVDENNRLAMTYNVASIPTIMIFSGGKLVQQFMGVQSKAKLQQALDEAKSA